MVCLKFIWLCVCAHLAKQVQHQTLTSRFPPPAAQLEKWTRTAGESRPRVARSLTINPNTPAPHTKHNVYAYMVFRGVRPSPISSAARTPKTKPMRKQTISCCYGLVIVVCFYFRLCIVWVGIGRPSRRNKYTHTNYGRV